MNEKIIRYIDKWWFRHFIFIGISLILFLPFLINGELITWNDSIFHFTRIYEVIKEQQHNQFFPDIVQYSGLQNWGYGLNFFYPTYALTPLILLWRLLGNPVLAFILFDIFIIYFSSVINYSVLKKASSSTLNSFLFSLIYVSTACTGTGLALSIPVVRLALITQYTSNIVFLFAPVIIISFYQIIFKSQKSFWRTAVVFSALSVMLSIPATLGLVFFILGMVIVGVFRNRMNVRNISFLLKIAVAIVCLSAIFIIPFLEQRLGSSWASLPIKPTLWGMSFFDKVIKKIFDFSDILSIFVIVIFILLILRKKLNHNFKYIAFSYLASLLFLYSSVFPWYLVQNVLSGALQMTYRWDFIPHIIGSYFVAKGVVALTSEKSKMVLLFPSVALTFAVLGMYGNTISTYFPVIPPGQEGTTKPQNTILNKSFEPTNESLRYSVPYRVNNKNISMILNRNFATRKDWGIKPDDPSWSSLAFDDYRIEGQYKDYRNVYSNSLVKFDGKLHKNMTSAQGEDFFINNLPANVNKVQAPITYLKGFKAFNSNGEQLTSYKNKDGFIEVETEGADRIKITYKKTFLHKISIFISTISWFFMIFGMLFNKFLKIKKRNNYEKISNRSSSLQRRRSSRTIRKRGK